MFEALDAALAARDADATAAALAPLDAGTLDPRRLATAINLLAQMRHNRAAHRTYESGAASHGVEALVQAGFSLNGLIYACCRESAMLPLAMALWELLGKHNVPPEAVPAEKLVLANLAVDKHDDAFSVFLGALDAGIQVCIAYAAIQLLHNPTPCAHASAHLLLCDSLCRATRALSGSLEARHAPPSCALVLPCLAWRRWRLLCTSQ